MLTIEMEVVLAGLALAVAFVALRLAPLWSTRQRGCDAFYFLMTAEAFRARPRLPIELPPYYLLEEPTQYYPPGLSVFLAALPPGVLRRHHWVVSHFLDMPVMGALAWSVGADFGMGWGVGAGLAYAVSPYLLTEYTSLTSRPLGHALAVAHLGATYAWIAGSPWAVVVAVITGVLLLYTHKLSVQLLWFLVPLLALAHWDWRWLVPVLASYAGAAAVAPRYFARLEGAHADIIRFWSKNWRLLGAHVVEDSPVYGAEPRTSGFHGRSWRDRAVTHACRLARHHPWLAPVLVAVSERWPLSPPARFATLWALGVYMWALMTLFVPELRGLGEGTKYLKYASVPVLYLTAWALADDPSGLVITAALLAAVASVIAYVAAVRRVGRVSRSTTGFLSDELIVALEPLRGDREVRLFCLPLHLSDVSVYAARKPVLWGSHHRGFRNLEPIFPVLRTRLETLQERYGLTHVLLDISYADPTRLGLGPDCLEAVAGDYQLFRLSG